MHTVGSRLTCSTLFLGLVGAHGAGAITFVPEVHFPLEPGSFWTFQVDRIDEVTFTVLEEVELVNGVETTVVERSSGEPPEARENFTNDENGLRVHKVFSPGPEGATLVYRPALLLSAAEMEVGESVRSMGKVDLTVSWGLAILDYSSTVTVVGPEVVEVPAGRFDTMRVEQTMIFSDHLGEVQRRDLTTWLAANIGQVKEVYTTTGASTKELVLVHTNVPEPSAGLLHIAGIMAIVVLAVGWRGGSLGLLQGCGDPGPRRWGGAPPKRGGGAQPGGREPGAGVSAGAREGREGPGGPHQGRGGLGSRRRPRLPLSASLCFLRDSGDEIG